MLPMATEPLVDSDRGLPRRVGVALGSGSARGLAHIGVLDAIEEAGLEVAAIAGSSMGAFIGAAYAAGRLDRLAAEFRAMDWKGIAALLDPVFPRSGLIDGQKVADWVRAQVGAVAIEALPVPFRAIATDLASGEAVAIGAGDLIEAVRASIAVPGIFTPARVDGRLLVDGGLVDPVPVGAVRALGVDFVIAVDLNHDIVQHRLARAAPAAGNDRPYAQALARLLGNGAADNPVRAQLRRWLAREKTEPLPGIFDVLLASIYIMQARITRAALRHDRPQILIQPPLGAVRFMEFDRAREIIDIGYDAARACLAAWRR